MKKQFEVWKASKKERLKAISEIIQKHGVRNQTQLIDLLKKEYRIIANQSAISRDVKSLGLVKDHKTSCYVLSQESQQKLHYRKLALWAKQAEVKSYDSSFEGLLFRTAPHQTEIAHLIASTIEKVFSTDERPVTAFVNQSGFIWLIVPVEKKQMIQKNLDRIF